MAPGPPTTGTVLAIGAGTTAPVAVPAGVAANDIIIVLLYLEASRTITPPAGFTAITGNPNSTAQQHEYLWWKRATGADAGTYSFSWTTSAVRKGVAIRIPAAVTSGDPVDVSDRAARSSNGTVTPAVTVTTTGADRLLLWVGTNFQAGTWTPPASYTELVDSGEITVAHRDQAAAGSSGSVTGTGSNSGQQTAALLALSPAVVAITGVLAAALGALTATAAAIRTVPAVLAAPLGALTATVSGVVTQTRADAALGGLTATAAAVRTTRGSMAAPLGAATGTILGRRTVTAAAAAPLGALTATAVGTFISYLGATGPALNPVVWRVDRATLQIVGPPLALWETLDLSPIANAAGSCQLVYPAAAPGFDALFANVSASPQLDQEIEVWLAGSAEHRTRWLLGQKAGDDLRPGDLWTFTGAGLEQLLAEVLVGPQATESKELAFSGVTYGTILITALQQAQLRTGVLVGVTWDFTTTLDSDGNPWDSTIADVAFAPDDTLLAVAELGPTELLGEFAMGPDRVLSAFNYGARGVDRSTGGNPLRLQAGANLAEVARRESSRPGDAATAALAKGAEGQYQWATDATAQAQRGRRVEVAVDAGQIASSGGVLAAAQGQVEVLKAGLVERTHGVVFGAGLPIPGVDYDVADTGLSVTGNTFSAQRITQWTMRLARDGRARGTVRTNTRIQDRLDRLARQLERVRRGATVVGTSTPSAEVDDGKAPAAPTGLTASSSGYRDADGATQAVVVAAWSDVTTNADATAADDIVGYLPAFRYTGGAPLPTGWQPLAQVADNATDFDGLVAGQAIEVRVAAVDKWGRIGANSTAYALTTGADATPPPTPSTPVVESYLGVLTIEWDGKGSAAQVQPPDFSHVEVHVSTSSGFTVNRPLNSDGTLNELTSTTYLDRLSGAGTLPSTIGNYGDTYYAKLVAVDRSNNASASSAQDSALLAQANDGDIGAVSIGKLTTGILSALMTVSNIIRTAASGSRVELDTNGFRCYLGSTVVLDFSIPSSALSLIGKLTSGAGVGVGRTIIVDPNGDGGSNPAISLYPNATNQRIRWRALNDANPDNGTSVPMFHIHTLSAAGVQEGGSLETWDQALWMGTKKSGAWRGGAVKLYHPDWPSGAGAFLAYQDNATGVDAYVHVAENGEIQVQSDDTFTVSAPSQVLIDGPADSHLFINSTGSSVTLRADTNNRVSLGTGGSQLISGGVVKSFVIEHPTDPDRWLVHACTESPTAGVEYWGHAIVENNEAVVDLPPYFEALTEEEGRVVILTPELAEQDGMPMLLTAAPSRIVDGRFRIVCPAPDGARVGWLVKATRRGATFEVEPLRSAVDVRGAADSPYRFVTPIDPGAS